MGRDSFGNDSWKREAMLRGSNSSPVLKLPHHVYLILDAIERLLRLPYSNCDAGLRIQHLSWGENSFLGLGAQNVMPALRVENCPHKDKKSKLWWAAPDSNRRPPVCETGVNRRRKDVLAGLDQRPTDHH
jgi:hypothetical protein